MSEQLTAWELGELSVERDRTAAKKNPYKEETNKIQYDQYNFGKQYASLRKVKSILGKNHKMKFKGNSGQGDVNSQISMLLNKKIN